MKHKNKSKDLELTKTLVLNFNEVEDIAKFEKKTSKKPAIIIAIIGLFAIFTGVIYPSVYSMVKKDNNISSDSKLRENTEVVNISDGLTCMKADTDSVNLLTNTTTYNFKFDKNGLSNYEKTLNIASTNPSLVETPKVMIDINSMVDPLIITPITGYTLYKSMKNDATNVNIVNNYTVKLVVDFTTFNSNSLSDQYNANDFFRVIYKKGDSFNNIKNSLSNMGCNCK